ncbi:MAG: ribbon-helix-helix domain-containing protein [Gallionella sp.]|nr:ribbon-helix-helix domain-containing protein [Gallionella sp.]
MALYLEPEQASALAALSERTRVPKQVYLREGLDLILAKYSKEA